ncbi:spermidine/putrescine ABC transporter substrate-binding protein [Planotetraspora thailandica]|uniref:Spermidine/putrescine ABC transporter substrate-binding protein n=1 Tax=Planotetraspora thailandica TaxID=487172 RepID=A0A8J3XWH3_9ACTN|nr:spermidine/putrescine ABC transporter substrate-binding protein [Planotetraspora thailandica]GII57622.1 spermidine/putrescine ABC transporter substrate-binding protein [Planotetraspora thailandica]
MTRHVPVVLASAGLAFALAACGGASSTGEAAPATLDAKADLSKQSLTISIWDGYSPKDLPQTVKAKLGFNTTVAIHDTNETVMAKLTAGGDSGIDVAFVSGQYAQALNAQGLLEPIHADLVPNLTNLYPEAAQLPYDKGNTFSVPYTWGTTGLCYRSDLVKTPPTSWNDLLSPPAELKKKITMMTTERWLALPALKMLGASVNTTDQATLDKAKAMLLKVKPDLLAYDDTTFGDRLKSGEAAMVEAWDGWCPTDQENIKFVVPKEGSDLWVDTMVILKSSKNKEAAHAFVNHVLDPSVHGWVPPNILYKVPNKTAMESVDPALLKDHPELAQTPADLLKGEGLIDLGEASVAYTRLATEVAAAQ